MALGMDRQPGPQHVFGVMVELQRLKDGNLFQASDPIKPASDQTAGHFVINRPFIAIDRLCQSSHNSQLKIKVATSTTIATNISSAETVFAPLSEGHSYVIDQHWPIPTAPHSLSSASDLIHLLNF